MDKETEASREGAARELLEKLWEELSGKGVRYIDSDEDHVWFQVGKRMYEICVPHSGNKWRWLFRSAEIEGFDRWANSTQEEGLYATFSGLRARLSAIDASEDRQAEAYGHEDPPHAEFAAECLL